jgi:hypothetical protein
MRALTPYHVRSIEYVCRPLDPREAPEQGSIVGYWTGAIDAWGKHTIQPIGEAPALYLFADEIKHVRPLSVEHVSDR